MYLRSTCQGLLPGVLQHGLSGGRRLSQVNVKNYTVPGKSRGAASAAAKLGLHAFPVDAREAIVLHCDVMELKYQFV